MKIILTILYLSVVALLCVDNAIQSKRIDNLEHLAIAERKNVASLIDVTRGIVENAGTLKDQVKEHEQHFEKLVRILDDVTTIDRAVVEQLGLRAQLPAGATPIGNGGFISPTNLPTLFIGAVREPLICPTCKAEGKTSTVRQGASWTTLVAPAMPTYDQNGNQKTGYYDPNTTTTMYECSNGHTFSRSR